MATEKFTPERLLSEPRWGPAIPNHDGTLALYTERHRYGPATLRVRNIATGDSRLLSKYGREAKWLNNDSNTAIFLEHDTWGSRDPKIVIINFDSPQDKERTECTIDGYMHDFKVQPLQDGSIAFVGYGLVNPDGHLTSRCDSTSTILQFDDYAVQDWNTYIDRAQTYSMFYSTLSNNGNAGWELNKPLHDALAGTKLAPLRIYGPGDDVELGYDISQGGIAFPCGRRGKDDPSRSSISSLYYIRLDSFNAARVHEPIKIGEQEDPDSMSGYLRFSPDGSQIAFLRSRERIPRLCIHRLGLPNFTDVFDEVTGKDWPLIPDDFEFTPNGEALYMTANDSGRKGLYRIDLKPDAYPKTLLRDGCVKGYKPIRVGNDEKVFVTSSSIVDSSLYRIVDANGNHEPTVVLSATNHGASLGISSKQVSEIYFPGGGDYSVHAWMVRPKTFDEGRKYPLVILVREETRESWNDEWYSMFNLALWAEQGYIVVAPNITGSRGYGVEFEKALNDNWGGRPYTDLVKCMEYVERLPNVAIENAVIAGHGYGGYMVNWIQGQPLGRRCKTMVCCDGIFHLPSHSLQSDIPLPDDFGGSSLLWKNAEGLERYNPARADLLSNWKTPMLIVHGHKNYRYPIGNALGAFHTLQALNTTSRLIVFQHEGHGTYNFGYNLLNFHQHVFCWINYFTGITDKTGVEEDSDTSPEELPEVALLHVD
ncbi:prolyl oligopeptidase [Jackrogersella minutella]|nr:prolyl oligopeptidase [Jackrogersella minutella]